MPVVHCKICRSKFYSKPSWLQYGGGKYCSKTCHYEGLKKGKIVKCFKCGAETYKPPKQLQKSKSKKYFCSKSCQTKWRNSIFIGPDHANWKHGLSTYRAILGRSNIPKFCKLCRSNDKRILAVHHINHNRKDNRIQNLAWLCHNCHFLVHHYINEKEKFMVSIA